MGKYLGSNLFLILYYIFTAVIGTLFLYFFGMKDVLFEFRISAGVFKKSSNDKSFRILMKQLQSHTKKCTIFISFIFAILLFIVYTIAAKVNGGTWIGYILYIAAYIGVLLPLTFFYDGEDREINEKTKKLVKFLSNYKQKYIKKVVSEEKTRILEYNTELIKKWCCDEDKKKVGAFIARLNRNTFRETLEKNTKHSDVGNIIEDIGDVIYDVSRLYFEHKSDVQCALKKLLSDDLVDSFSVPVCVITQLLLDFEESYAPDEADFSIAEMKKKVELSKDESNRTTNNSKRSSKCKNLCTTISEVMSSIEQLSEEDELEDDIHTINKEITVEESRANE